MPISVIHNWLVTRGPFDVGVALLKKYGDPTDAELLLFGMRESPFSREKLVAALRTVNDAAHAPTIVKRRSSPRDGQLITSREADIEENAFNRSLTDPKDQVQEELLPADLRPLRRQLTEQWREYTFLRGTMVNLPAGMELRSTAGKVIHLRAQIRKGWRIIEHWRQTGHVVKVSEEVKPNDPVSLMKRKNALEVWLSQRRTGARKGTAEAIAAKQKELSEVKALLNAYTDKA
jgi:hypothetical protein